MNTQDEPCSLKKSAISRFKIVWQHFWRLLRTSNDEEGAVLGKAEQRCLVFWPVALSRLLQKPKGFMEDRSTDKFKEISIRETCLECRLRDQLFGCSTYKLTRLYYSNLYYAYLQKSLRNFCNESEIFYVMLNNTSIHAWLYILLL
jgi:hypothetical protein